MENLGKRVYVVKDVNAKVIALSNDSSLTFKFIDTYLNGNVRSSVGVGSMKTLDSKLPLANDFLINNGDEIRDYLVAIQRANQDKEEGIKSMFNNLCFRLEKAKFNSASTLKTMTLGQLRKLFNDTKELSSLPFIIYDYKKDVNFK